MSEVLLGNRSVGAGKSKSLLEKTPFPTFVYLILLIQICKGHNLFFNVCCGGLASLSGGVEKHIVLKQKIIMIIK